MPRFPAVDRRVLRYEVTVTSEGEPVEPERVLVALLPHTTEPTADTAWTAVPLVAGEIAVTVAGDQAGPGEGLVAPRGTYKLRVRVLDNPESITEVAEVITIY